FAQRPSASKSRWEDTAGPATPSGCARGAQAEPRRISTSAAGLTERLRQKRLLLLKCTADVSACRGTAEFFRSEFQTATPLTEGCAPTLRGFRLGRVGPRRRLAPARAPTQGGFSVSYALATRR